VLVNQLEQFFVEFYLEKRVYIGLISYC